MSEVAASVLPVDVVIPTRNRAEVVERKVRWLLERAGVARVIVVADGCTDDTVARCCRINPDRVSVIANPTPRGPSAARNLGVGSARTEWIALLDDDDCHPDDYLSVLASVAGEADADIVGAPWVGQSDSVDLESEVARRRHLKEGPSIDNVAGFPSENWVETPWLPPCVIARRAVFERVSYDDGYRGNFWREETDFFVSAQRAGFRLVLTGETFSWRGRRAGGGVSRDSAWRYELSCLVNNWRFLQKHGAWLRERHGFRRPLVAQTAFTYQRAVGVARGWLRPRVRVVVGVLRERGVGA